MTRFALALALVAAFVATPALSEEQPPPIQPRSARNDDPGPTWVATTKATCGGHTVVLWECAPGTDKALARGPGSSCVPFWRMYYNLMPRGIKTLKEVDGELYFRGKKCTVDTPAA